MFHIATFFGGIVMNTRSVPAIIISTILVISLSAFAGEPDTEIDDLRAELARLQAENQELREKAERLEKYNQGWHDWYIYLTKLCDEHGIKYGKLPVRTQERQQNEQPVDPVKAVWLGFRGIQWGTEIGAIPGLRFTENRIGLVWHTRDTDVLKIGNADLFCIEYGFYKGKLCSVFISCHGFENSCAFRAAVRTTYEKGSDTLFFYDKCIGGPPNRKVRVFLSDYSFRDMSSCMITYLPIEHQRQRDDEDAAKGAAKDF